MLFQKLTKEQFDLVFPILEESFPVEELRTKENQLNLLDKPEYSLCAIKSDAGAMQGVAAYWDFADFLFIEHLAIKKEARNSGIGGKRLQKLLEEMDRPVVLEVELPEGEMEMRRVAFYERLGFVFNEFAYLQPPMQEGHDLLPLRLMTYPNAIDEETYKRYKETLYKYVYEYEE